MNIAQVRAQYPQYQDLSDKQLADALHAKFYSDIPIQEYYGRIGLTSSKERTFGEAAKDIAAGVVSGAGSLVQLPGQLYGLATGDFSETGALGVGKDIAKYGEEMKSAGLKAREAERAEKIKTAEQKGQWEAFKTAFGETVKDPALLTSFLAEQAPQLLVPFGAAKVAQIGTAAKAAAAAEGLVGKAAENAVKEVTKAAAEHGTRAAIGAGAVQQGADVGAQAYEDIYKELIRKGAEPKDAADGAINLARAAGVSGALISLLAQRLPGAKALEETFAGVPGKGGRLLNAAKGALGEGVSEVVEETGGKFGANLAMREVKPEQSLLEGLGQTAGMAAVGGVGMGGVSGLARRPAGKEQAPAPEAPRTGPLTPEEQTELDRQRAAAERPKTTEELLAGIQTGKPTTAEDIARIKDEHETAVIEGLLAQDAEMKQANDWIAAEMERVNQLDELRNQARDEEERQAIERRILDLGIKDVDQRVRETRILSRVQDLIDRNIPYASTAINDINQKFGVINEAPLTEDERARVENIMGMVNTFTNFVNLPVLAPRTVDQFAENQAMEALIKERTERGQTEPLRTTPPAPSPRIEETPVSQGVGEGAALRPTSGVEPSVAEDRELVTPAPIAPPAAPVTPPAPPVEPAPVVEAATPTAPVVEAPASRSSEAWRTEGKTPQELMADKVESVGVELAMQIAEEASAKDFTPTELPAAIQQWATDSKVPADDLRASVIKALDKFDISEARKSQVRKALSPLRAAAPKAEAPAVEAPAKPVKAAAIRKQPNTVMGSTILADVSNRLGGLDLSLLSEFSTKFLTKRKDKYGRSMTMWRNPMIKGVGTLFRKGGESDYVLIAAMLEEAGYLEPGAVERDYKEAGERAKELIKAALNRQEVTTLEQQEKQEQEDEEANRQAWLEQQEELKAERDKAAREAGLTPYEGDLLTDDDIDLFAPTGPQTDEQYATGMRGLGFDETEIADAVQKKQERERAEKTTPSRPAEARAVPETGEGTEGLERYTPEEVTRKQEEAEQAAAEEKKAKAAEQERLRKEQQAKEEKARADESAKDFELGKSAEEQMTGMGDLFAEPPAPPKREPRQGTPKQLETAEKIAKPFGATVVYQDGDLALMRGFSKGNGQPVYMAINLPYYFEKDIESLKFPKDLVTPEQRTELIKIKQNLEAEDKIKFDKSPSIKFTDGLATSRNISPEIAGVVRGWKDLLGLKVNLYITTVGDAIADRNRFNGPHRAVGSAGINDREAGVVRKLPNGDYYIAFKISTSKTKMLEVIAHELGHIHELEVFNRADEATRQQILDEHSKWLKRQTGKTAREFVTALRAKTAGKTTRIGEGMMASEMDSRYWKAFTEWYADQVSRWAVTSEKPISVVEKFFSRLAQALKSFYSKLKNAGYLPNETFVQYLNKTHQPSDHVITPDEGIAGQMLGEVEPTGTPGQQALATINRMGMGVKPPEPGKFAKLQKILKDAGENPAGTKESAKKALIKFGDWFETTVFSGDAAWSNTIHRNVIKDMKENEEVLGKLLEIRQSQTVNADNVVSRGLIEGTIEYDEETKKHQSVKKEENFAALSKKLDELATKYDLTKEQMERIAHTYLVAKRLPGIIKRNEELDAEIKAEEATAKPDRKSIDKWKSLKVFVSPQQEAMVEPGLSLLKDIPELSQIPKMINEIRKNHITFMVDSGLWSAEYAQAMWDNIDWVPFYREEQLEADAGPQEIIRGLQVKSKEFQMKGSEAAVNDVFENMMLWSQYAMNRGIRADKARRMIDVAKDIDVGDRKMAVRVTEEKRGMNIVRIFRDGKQELWDVADPMFMDAFASIQNVSIPMFKWAAKVADVLRNSVVLYPMFSVAQVPQDSFAAMYTSGLKPQYALRIPILAVKEFIKTLNKTSATHNELVKYGVVGARNFSAEVMRQDAEIFAGMKPPKGGWNKTKDFLEHIAMSADNAVRQAVYEAARQQGVSKAEALEKAFEIFNVRRRGTSKALNLAGQTIPFFYAYLAAQRVAYRTITGVGTSPTERKAALQTLAATSAAVFTLSMLYAMMVGDDKDYEETPAAVRDRTLTIPGTGGVRIPLRADFFLFPKMIAEHTYLMLTDKGYEDGAKFRRSMRDGLVNAVASPTPLPQIAKPSLEVAINYSFFDGKPVVGTFEKQKDMERQFNDSTSEFSKLLGQTGLVSPIAADHLIRGMLGSAGGLALYGTNMFLHSDPDVPRPEMSAKEMLAALPGTSGFLKRPQESALKNDFFVLRDEVEKAVNTFNDIKTRSPQGIEDFLADEKQMARLMLGKPVDKINRELSKIRKVITQITNMPESQMSADEKSDNIRQLREVEREMLKSVNVKELREMAKI